MASYYDQKPWLKTYPQWLPSNLTVPGHSVLDAFLHAASAWPADPCLHYFDRTLNYREIQNMATALSAHAVSLTPGELVVEIDDEGVMYTHCLDASRAAIPRPWWGSGCSGWVSFLCRR